VRRSGLEARRAGRRALTPDIARVVARWAGVDAAPERLAGLAVLFQAFRERVRRLHAIDVAGVEFDFLRPTDRRPDGRSPLDRWPDVRGRSTDRPMIGESMARRPRPTA
jgi:hypothetical protein